jgi:hypothetical protein
MSDNKKKNVKRNVRTLAARDLMKATGGNAGAAPKFPGTLGFVPTPKAPPSALGMMPHGPSRHRPCPVLGLVPSHKPILGLVPTK